MVANTPASRKQKGRLFQQYVRDAIIATFNLHQDDVRSCSMGSGGEDIQLSPRAREVFPYSIECKNTEKLNVWAAYKQAAENSKTANAIPILIFKRSREKPVVMVDLEHFLLLTKRLRGSDE